MYLMVIKLLYCHISRLWRVFLGSLAAETRKSFTIYLLSYSKTYFMSLYLLQCAVVEWKLYHKIIFKCNKIWVANPRWVGHFGNENFIFVHYIKLVHIVLINENDRHLIHHPTGQGLIIFHLHFNVTICGLKNCISLGISHKIQGWKYKPSLVINNCVFYHQKKILDPL